MVSEAKLIDNEYSRFTMPVVEFFESGLCGTIYDIESPSQRLISTINTSDTFNDYAQTEKNVVPAIKTFMSKERHLVVSEESIANRWCVGMNNAK